jgi:hypothetical protein
MDPKKTSVEQETVSINAGLQALAIRALINDLAAARVRIAELEAKAAEPPLGTDK